MIDFISNTLGAATLTWTVAFALRYFGFDNAWSYVGAAGLLLSALGFGAMIVGTIVWTVRHVRITIV